MEFLKKKDFLYPLLICILLLAISGFSYFYMGNFIYDTGREFLVPDLINNKNVLIKDIFISYFPLSYQINALLFKIFGSNLDVLRITGIFCLLLIGYFMYFISREFLTPEKSFLAALCTLFISTFNVSLIANYILTYSYAFIYGTLALFISNYFMVQYIKYDKFLYPAFFFLGAAFALKAEFVFIFIPYMLLLFYKKTNLKKGLVALLLFFLPILLSFGTLFLNGLNLSDLKNYFIFLQNFMNSKILKYYSNLVFYKNPVSWLLYNLKNFYLISLNFLVCAIFLRPLNKTKNKFLKCVLYFVSAALVLLLAILKGRFYAGEYFSFGCIFVLAILIYSIKKKNIPLAFLSLSSLLLTVRFNFLYANSYLTYTLPFGLLVICIFLFSKNKIFIQFFSIFALVNIIYFTVAQSLPLKYEITSPKGKIISLDKNETNTINETINFINENTKKEDTILILPEGAMFNYVTERKTNPKFYQLIPNHIEALNEENIISNIDMPNYILILNTDYSIYGTPQFCLDFGQKICKFVYQNYTLQKTIGDENSLNAKMFKKSGI